MIGVARDGLRDRRGRRGRVVDRTNGFPSTLGRGISTAGRGEPLHRATGIVGQLSRVRGRTPGLPPAGRPPAPLAVRLSCSNGSPIAAPLAGL